MTFMNKGGLLRDNPPVSVIILNYNGLRYLRGRLSDSLRSVLNSNYFDFEVLFVDNGSSDDSVEFVNREFGKDPRLRIIGLPRNYGYPLGNNIGAMQANKRSKFLIFLNSDVEVTPSWMIRLVSSMEEDIAVGAAQPKILLWRDRSRINSVGMLLTPLGRTVGPSGPSTGLYELDKGQYNRKREIFSVLGAAFIVRRDLFFRVGAFDGDYFLYGEEIDLCWRIWLAGYKVMLCPNSIVYHYEGGTAGSVRRMTPMRAYYGERNRLATLIKNYELVNVLKYAPLLIIWSYATFTVQALRIRSPLFLVQLTRAYLEVLIGARHIVSKRHFIQGSLRLLSDESLMLGHDIFWGGKRATRRQSVARQVRTNWMFARENVEKTSRGP